MKKSSAYPAPRPKRKVLNPPEYVKAGAAAGAGAAVGAGASASIGGMGLTVAGTAVSVGAGPVILAGAVVGLAGYGVYRLVKG